MIRNDLSHLPAATDTPAGEPPDPTPRFVHLLADATPPRAPATNGARIRTSDAGKCARAIGYRAAGIDRTNTPDRAGHWVGVVSDLVKAAWYDALTAAYPDATIGLRPRLPGLDDVTGWIDAVIDTHRPLTPQEEVDIADAPDDIAGAVDHTDFPGIEHRILIALNVTGGFAFKHRVGERGDPEGPSHAHKLEAALNALAVDADEIVIAYLATEVISRDAATRKGFDEVARFGAEWSYTRETFEPWAATERSRLEGILALVDTGTLPARKIPGLPAGTVIVDPAMGRWEQRTRDGAVLNTGCTWLCGYCSWRDVCATTGPGRIPAPVPVTLGGTAA